MRAVCAFSFGLALTTVAAASSASTFQARPSPSAALGGPIKVRIRNVVLYPYRDAPARVAVLSGSAAPTRAGGAIVLDEIGSYGIMIQHAQVHLSAPSMTVLMNRYVLPASNGPIKHVDITFGAGTIAMSGTLVKGHARIRFKASAVPEPTADGDMRIRIVKMTAGGFVPKGVTDALGLKMSKVAQPRNTAIFHMVGDDMIMPVVSMLPPPKVSGMLRSVTVTPRDMTIVIGTSAAIALPALSANSYIHYRGGVLKFAKLTMRDVDLTVVPKEPGGTLGFSPASYYRQLVAGFTVPQPNRGLVAHVPDYASMSRGPR
jgi:hypothetical protein